MKTTGLLLGLCVLVALAVILPVRAQYGSGTGSYGSVGTSSTGGNVSSGGTLPAAFTTIWDTNKGFLLYYCGDPNVGNTNTGSMWTYSFNPNVGYTNGMIAYSNVWVASSNQWIIYSNGTPLYAQNPNTSTYGSVISGLGYAKGKGMFGPTPAPIGFGYPFLSWAGAARASAPPVWAGVTSSAPQVCVTSSVSLYAPNFVASAGMMLGSNCTFQIPGLEPAGSASFYPMVILGGFNDVAAGQLDSIISSGTCTNFDLNAAIIASSSCTMLKGLGDDAILCGENVLAQHLGSSVCATIACFGATNFSTGTSVLMGSQGCYMDGGCVNFVGIGQFNCYDDVNIGFASGAYQTNGGPPQATGASPSSGIFDFGNGNIVTNPNTVFFGFTNQGLTISGNGSVNIANSNTLASVATPAAGMTLWISNASSLYVTWTNGLTYSLLTLPNVAIPFLTTQTNFISGWVYSNTLYSAPINVTATVTNQTTGAALMELRVTGGSPLGGAYTNMVTLPNGMTNATMFAMVPNGANYTFTNTMGTAGVRFGQLQPQ